MVFIQSFVFSFDANFPITNLRFEILSMNRWDRWVIWFRTAVRKKQQRTNTSTHTHEFRLHCFPYASVHFHYAVHICAMQMYLSTMISLIEHIDSLVQSSVSFLCSFFSCVRCHSYMRFAFASDDFSKNCVVIESGLRRKYSVSVGEVWFALVYVRVVGTVYHSVQFTWSWSTHTCYYDNHNWNCEIHRNSEPKFIVLCLILLKILKYRYDVSVNGKKFQKI